jgi:hypothetical protein
MDFFNFYLLFMTWFIIGSLIVGLPDYALKQQISVKSEYMRNVFRAIFILNFYETKYNTWLPIVNIKAHSHFLAPW